MPIENRGVQITSFEGVLLGLLDARGYLSVADNGLVAGCAC